MNLRIRPDGSVYVSASKWVPEAFIENFILSNSDYIFRALKRAEEKRAAMPAEPVFADGEPVFFFGCKMSWKIVPGEKNTVYPDGDRLVMVIKNPENADARKKLGEAWLKEQLEIRMKEICENIYPFFKAKGFGFPELKYRKMVSKWGVCRPKAGTITFNTYLSGAPLTCIEYIAVHEFVHYLHPDHSAAFYKCLAGLLPDWKERDRLLKSYPLIIR